MTLTAEQQETLSRIVAGLERRWDFDITKAARRQPMDQSMEEIARTTDTVFGPALAAPTTCEWTGDNVVTVRMTLKVIP